MKKKPTTNRRRVRKLVKEYLIAMDRGPTPGLVAWELGIPPSEAKRHLKALRCLPVAS